MKQIFLKKKNYVSKQKHNRKELKKKKKGLTGISQAKTDSIDSIDPNCVCQSKDYLLYIEKKCRLDFC